MIKEEQPQQIISEPTLENDLKSNNSILKVFMSNNLENMYNEIKEITTSKIFQDKLRLLFKYYKPRGTESLSVISNRKLLNKIPINDILGNLISKVADNLNLNIEQTFDLVDLFFQSESEELNKFIRKSNFLKALESDPFTQRHYSESTLNEYRGNITSHQNKLHDQIVEAFYKERTELLKLLDIFLKISAKKNDPISSQCMEILKQIDKDNEIVYNLWDTFKGYTADFRICKHLDDFVSKEKHTLQILKEQSFILDTILFIRVKMNSGKMFQENYMDLLGHFARQNFMGYYNEVVNTRHLEHFRQEQEKIAQVIIDQEVLLSLYYLDLYYVFNLDNKIEDDLKGPNLLDVNKMPYLLFKKKENLEAILNLFENNTDRNFAAPIFMAFYSLFLMVNANISDKTLTDSEIITNLRSISQERIKSIEENCKIASALDFMSNMYNRPIFTGSENRTCHPFYKFIIKLWMNIVIKYYFKYRYTYQLVDLCVKTLKDITNSFYFWTVDLPMKTPMGYLFESILGSFPYDFELLLSLCIVLKGSKNNIFSSYIFHRLSDMEYFSLECAENEISVSADQTEAELNMDKHTGWGLVLPKRSLGQVTKLFHDKFGNVIRVVKFGIKYSLFTLLYSKWMELIEKLHEITNAQTSVNELIENREYNNTIQFVRLFTSLISDNSNFIVNFFNCNYSSQNKYIGETENYEQLKNLLIFSLETINLLTKNRQMYYSLLHSLSNSIYMMIESIIKNPHFSADLITVVIRHFVNGFEGILPGREGVVLPTYGNKYSRVPLPSVSMNLIEIFGNTIMNDFNNKSFENSILVLKIIKNFFKYPHIIDFVKNMNSYDFLLNLWQSIIVELVKTMTNMEYYTTKEEFDMSRQLVKIVHSMFRLIAVANTSKAEIIAANPSSNNSLVEMVISCLNSIETSELIFKILKTRVVTDTTGMFLKDKFFLKNILFDNFIYYGDTIYIDKIKAKKLIKNAFKCLNQIFDLICLYRTSSDEVTQKLYGRLDTIKLWDNTLFTSKTIPTFDSRTVKSNEVYTINLILSIFSYVDFEERECLDFTKACAKIPVYEPEEPNNILFHEMIDFTKPTDKDYNICTLALACMNRILVILKLQSLGLNEGNVNINKATNLLNYLILKKESTAELENTNNYFDKFKEILCFNLLKQSDFSYKIEILKFLTECASSQIGFLTMFLDDVQMKIHTSNKKANKFWEIFGILVSKHAPEPEGKQKHENMMGYLCIFLANIFTNDVIFKKTIREFLTIFKIDFDTFLNRSIDIFSFSTKESDLKDARQIIKKNIENVFFPCNNFLVAEDDFRRSCFHNIVVKSLSIIFAKLIIFSDASESSSKGINRFVHYKELSKFLNENVSNFIELYNCNINYEFINLFNMQLTEEQSFIVNMEMENENQMNINMSKSKMLSGSKRYFEYNYKENVILIKNVEKAIKNDMNNYFLPFTIDPYSGVFNYSVNYWIDLKELFINMRVRNYNIDLFIDNLSSFVEHNLELSLFEAKTQAMFSISYLLGLIFSIGQGNSFMSAYLFTNMKTFKAINKNEMTKAFAEQVLNTNRSSYPKLNFSLIGDGNIGMAFSEFLKFTEDKVVKKLQCDLNFCNSNGVKEDYQNGKTFSFYNQYVVYKYNILNFIVNYLVYLYNNKEDSSIGSFLNFPHNLFQKHFMKILFQVERDFPLFISNYKQMEVEKSILNIINVFYSILTYLIISDYNFSDVDINCINSLIQNLLVVFDLIPAYHAIIIFILNAYCTIPYFTDVCLDSEGNLVTGRAPNLMFNSDDHMIVKNLLKKLSVNLSEQEYLAIVTLFITLVDNYENALEVIMSEKILLAFQLNDRFRNSLEINEYQDNERGVSHILWCWTLIFLRQVCLRLGTGMDSGNMRYNSIYSSAVDFVINHESRIMKVLGETEYVDKGGNHIQKSLAYLEEVEFVTCLLNVLFVNSKKWKINYNEFYNRMVTVILDSTLRLFASNVKISKHYKCLSNVEKTLDGIFPNDVDMPKSYTNLKDERYTSFFSPMKKTAIRKEPTVVEPMSPRRDFSRNLNPNLQASSLFYYRVDQCLNKILYNCTNVIKSATVFESLSSKTSYVNYLREVYSRGSYGPNFSLRNFDEQCQNIIYALYFALHSLDSMNKNFTSLENLYRMSIIFFNNIDASVNFGNLNLVYADDRFEDIFHINNATIQNIFLISTTFHQLISYFRNTASYSFDNQLKEIVLKKMDSVFKMMKDRDMRVEGFKELSGTYDKLIDFVKRNFD